MVRRFSRLISQSLRVDRNLHFFEGPVYPCESGCQIQHPKPESVIGAVESADPGEKAWDRCSLSERKRPFPLLSLHAVPQGGTPWREAPATQGLVPSFVAPRPGLYAYRPPDSDLKGQDRLPGYSPAGKLDLRKVKELAIELRGSLESRRLEVSRP